MGQIASSMAVCCAILLLLVPITWAHVVGDILKEMRADAKQGDADAQYNLGFMYAEGLGVSRNYVLAYMWADLAAAQGDQDAIELREKLFMSMTPSQIIKAHKTAREWKPKK